MFATYYPAQGKLTPTLQYEGLREGIDDVRYLQLASTLMARLDETDAASAGMLPKRRGPGMVSPARTTACS